jgi:glycosyltransferase involved in cell wall biosynthesis
VYLRRDFPNHATRHREGVADEGAIFIDAGPPQELTADQSLRHAATFGQAMADLWGEQRPDVVHAHGWVAGMAAHVAAAECELPVVQSFASLTPRGRSNQSTDVMRPRLERSLALSAAQAVAPSTEAVFALTRMGVPQRTSTVLPPGIDADAFDRNGNREVRDASQFRILVVSDLVNTTDIERVLGAASLLRDTEVVVVGGPERRDLDDHVGAARVRASAKRLGIGHRVHVRGYVAHADMPVMYRSADVLVSMPDDNGTPLSALEAMAAGRPLVAAAAGGLVDLVIDGITGIHVPPRDGLALVEALRRLRNDPVLRDSMGLAGSDRARTRYSWPRIAAETRRIYAAVAQRTSTEAVVR